MKWLALAVAAAAFGLAVSSGCGALRDIPDAGPAVWPDVGPEYYFGGCVPDAGACAPEVLSCAIDQLQSEHAMCVEDYDCERVRLTAPCTELCEPQVVYADDAVDFSDQASLLISRFCGQPSCAPRAPKPCPEVPGAPACLNGACAWKADPSDAGDAGAPDAAGFDAGGSGDAGSPDAAGADAGL